MPVKHWFKDQHFRSLLKNSSYLAMSRGVAAIGGVATLAFAGRGLGLSLFGLLVLIHSYVQAASGLTKFNSWQVVVRFGSPALEKGDVETFRRATGFAVGLDFASGFATMAGALVLLPLVGDWFGIPADTLHYAMFYCLLLPTMGAGAPSGVLRALDRFDLLSWQGTIQPNMRAVLAGIALWQGWGFSAYLVIWFITDMFADLVLWAFAWRELRRRDLVSSLKPRLSAKGLENGWQFAVSVNLTASLNTAWGPLARLIVGGLLTPAAAGLYRVAAYIADAAQRPSDFLNKAFYPQVMRLDPSSKKPWKLMLRATAVSAAIGLAMVLFTIFFGEWLLRVAFGPEFVGAYGVLLIMLGIPLIAMVTFPLPAMLYTVGRNNTPLWANLVGVLTYVGAIFPLVDRFNLIGAGAAFLLGRIVMTLVMAVVLAGEHKKWRKAA